MVMLAEGEENEGGKGFLVGIRSSFNVNEIKK